MSRPTRPMLRWLGGKMRLAPEIVELMPPHTVYIEAYGGAGSVLFAKPRSYNEILNDLDDEVFNLYRVLRSSKVDKLLRQLRLTPYARAEYLQALKPCKEPVERARRLIIRSHMGHGSNAARIDRPTGFRSDGQSGTTNVAGEWASFPEALRQIVERLDGVTIQNRPALELIENYREPHCLLYLDPPYLPHTRSAKTTRGAPTHSYRHEMSVADHSKLLDLIADHPASILLSGYPDPMYDEALAHWERRTFAARAHRNLERTEVLWINPVAAARLKAPRQLGMFAA